MSKEKTLVKIQLNIEDVFKLSDGVAGSGWHKYKCDDFFLLDGSVPPDTDSSLLFFDRRLEAVIAYKTFVSEGIEAGFFCEHKIIESEESGPCLAVGGYGVVVNIPLDDPRFDGDPTPSWWLNEKNILKTRIKK